MPFEKVGKESFGLLNDNHDQKQIRFLNKKRKLWDNISKVFF